MTVAQHRNDDSPKNDVCTDCLRCASHEVHVLLSIAVIFKWTPTKLHFESAFLRTIAPAWDVYIIPPRDGSAGGNSLWLRRAAAYSLLNASTKF